jgi:hypothetical protein
MILTNMEVRDNERETKQYQIDDIVRAGYAKIFDPDIPGQAHREACDIC